MLKYDRTDMSEDRETCKTSNLDECRVCHYWYFFKIFSKSYQPLACNSYHDLLQKHTSFDDVVIFIVGRNDYRFTFCLIIKSEVVVDNYEFGEKK